MSGLKLSFWSHLAAPLQSKKATRCILLGITWVAFFVRVNNLAAQSLWRDEVDAIRLSSWPLRDLITGLVKAGHNGPLFFLLLRPWRALTGDSEFALRYPSAVLGALAAPLGFILARQLGFSRRSGIILALLLTTSPYLVWYGQEAKMYTLLLALVTLAVLVYLKALRGEGRKWWVIFVTITSLSYYTHILAPLMLPVYGVIALLQPAQLRARRRSWGVSMALLTLPYIPLALWQIPRLIRGYPSGHPFYPLKDELYLLLQLYSRGLLRSGGIAPIAVYIFLLLAGLTLVDKAVRRGVANRTMLAAWTFLPPLAAYLISRRVPVFEDRYLIYITPAFYLLVAVGLTSLRQYGRWLAGLCLGLLLTINLLGIWQQQTRPIKADFRAAAAYVAAQSPRPTAIMIHIPYLKYTWDYYYPYPYRLLEGLWTNDNKDSATVDVEMRALTAGVDELWLAASEEQLWDRRQMIRDWLNKHADLLDEAHFTRVDVYHYRLRPGSIDRQSQGPDGG